MRFRTLNRPIVRAGLILLAALLAMLASFLWAQRSEETREISGNFESDATLGSPLHLEYVPVTQTDSNPLFYVDGRMRATTLLRLPPLTGSRVELQLCGDRLFDEIKNNWPVKEVAGSLELVDPHVLEVKATSDQPLYLRFWPAPGRQAIVLPHEQGPIAFHDLESGGNYRFAFVFDSAPFQLTMQAGVTAYQVDGRTEVEACNRLCWTLRIPVGQIPEDEPFSYDSGINLYGADDSFKLADGATAMTLHYATAKFTLDDEVIEAPTSSIDIRFRNYGKFFFSAKGLRLEDGVADSVKINGQEQIKRERTDLIPTLPNLISALVGAAIAVLLTHDARRDSGDHRAG